MVEGGLVEAGLNPRRLRAEPTFLAVVGTAGTSVCVPLFVTGDPMATGDVSGDVAGDRGSSKLWPAYLGAHVCCFYRRCAGRTRNVCCCGLHSEKGDGNPKQPEGLSSSSMLNSVGG